MQKQLILSLIIGLVISSGATAQFRKGTWLVGGAVSGDYTKTKDSFGNKIKDEALSFSPQAAYFFFDKIAVGTGLNLDWTRTTLSYERYSSYTKSIAPFARYYAWKGLFIAGQVNWGSGQAVQIGEGIYQYPVRVWGWKANAGYAIFLNDFIAIEPSLGLRHDIQSARGFDSKQISTSYFLQVGFQIYIH